MQAKLAAEGLFDADRKRSLPYPPSRIGLITSGESAAYHDFIKILNGRWIGVEVRLADVQVQGDAAPAQIIKALDYLNTHEEVDVIVLTRGGGSAEDLGAFSTEQVTRAVAGSRTPTLVAIGHEVDLSLAELAADQRASTPSNAAELLVPDKRHEIEKLSVARKTLLDVLNQHAKNQSKALKEARERLQQSIESSLRDFAQNLRLSRQVLNAFNPTAALKRGYAIVKSEGLLIRSITSVNKGDALAITVADGTINAKVSD